MRAVIFPPRVGKQSRHWGQQMNWGGGSHSSAGKESACDAGDTGLISGSGRSPEEGISILGLP